MTSAMTDRIRTCPECVAAVTPALIGACASVGIERGATTSWMLHVWLRAYHERGHQEEAR